MLSILRFSGYFSAATLLIVLSLSFQSSPPAEAIKSSHLFSVDSLNPFSFRKASIFHNADECGSSAHKVNGRAGVCDPSLVHVAITLDVEYLRGSIAAVHSILQHSMCPESIFFHFLVSETNLENLVRSTFPQLKFKVYYFEPEIVRNMISTSVRQALEQPLNYARNYLADLLEPCVRRVIYLDSDLVVVDDIAKLWATSLGSKTIGAPEYCHANFTKYFTATFWRKGKFSATFYGRKPCYFNTGVMVIDLVKWRLAGYTKRIERWMEIQKSDRIYELGSLPPYLLVFAGHVAPIEHRWNQHGLGGDNVRGSCRDLHPGPVSLLHWSGSGKPWIRLDSMRWYLRPDDTTIYYDPKRAAAAAILQFWTAVLLYGYLIPISLYVSIEIVKILQSRFINQDIHMYYEEADKPALARTSNLNEELGQVDTILSDKTGTLTCNSMEFIKCSIAGTSYGRGVTEVERAMARRKGSPLPQEETEEEAIVVESAEEKVFVKGYNFVDERIINGNWVKEPRADVIQKFLRLLAICHTALPEIDEESGRVTYEAESPDEAAFVIAARELGFEFYERTQTSISLHELDPSSCRRVERSYKLLNVLEFSSSRKRMSVIVRNEEGTLLLLSKGADSVMFERLAENGREFEEQTKAHINEYADAGLRTLILAYRELDEEEYNRFNEEFTVAKNTVSADRDEFVEEVAEKIEKDLILLGATAVEDKLQNGVPECIDKLAQAGIKLWVLTGDKMETAINIGFACSLLRQGMQQIIINSDTPETKALEKSEDKSAVAAALKESVIRQILDGRVLLRASNESSEALALIIDGKSLTHALEDDVKDVFLELAIGCASVICCRSSPKQKALVTRLVKVKTGSTTLAIGDGANDVGMLQEADIGVGISGAEGMQAVMSSDIAIAQFRFLERLLLVHGHWCYRRISSMICYFFYKNIAFGFTLFFFQMYASFSGQTVYNDWFLSLYNVFFTSLPVIALGVFDQDVAARFCLRFPLLYQEGIQNVLFSWTRILGWAFNGVLSAIIIFFFCIQAMEQQAFRKGGEVAGLEILGATMYTCVVWVVNCQMALSISYFTYIQHIFIWGGIIFWYIFLLAYGAMDPNISTTAYKVFIEACAPAPFFWLITVLILISSLLPYFTYSSIQMRFFPLYHQMIQWIRFDGQTDDPEYVYMVRQRSLRPTTVGFTARFEASSRNLRADLEKMTGGQTL